MTPRKFREQVLAYYAVQGRDELPWRKTRDPYCILVSEIMLQQTQVERVVPYYQTFIERFPTTAALSEAPLSDVLRLWQGLGYNRRAKYLKEAAQAIHQKHNGVFPKTTKELEALPGIGPYTAAAVCAFAYNLDVVCVETNIRTAVLAHFFKDREQVSDKEILAVLEKALPHGDARTWYAALMDYGTHLKRTGTSLNAKSKSYTKQKPFKGSAREVRGAILRALAETKKTESTLRKLFPERMDDIVAQLHVLQEEGLIKKTKQTYSLAD